MKEDWILILVLVLVLLSFGSGDHAISTLTTSSNSFYSTKYEDYDYGYEFYEYGYKHMTSGSNTARIGIYVVATICGTGVCCTPCAIAGIAICCCFCISGWTKKSQRRREMISRNRTVEPANMQQQYQQPAYPLANNIQSVHTQAYPRQDLMHTGCGGYESTVGYGYTSYPLDQNPPPYNVVRDQYECRQK